jgi:putative ABC transport system substrate-binding protein
MRLQGLRLTIPNAHAGAIDPVLIRYANRLSDLLFVMARAANHRFAIAATGQVNREYHRCATGTLGSFGDVLVAKRLELAKEALPGLRRIGVFWNAANPGNDSQLRLTVSAAQTLGIELDLFPLRYPEGLSDAFATSARRGATAMLVLSDTVSARYAPQIAAIALEHRLPTIHYNRLYLVTGGGALLSYGTNGLDNARRAAAYVDRILKGADPGELPVEFPTRFVLVINLKTAKTLGLTIPESLLVRADELIE